MVTSSVTTVVRTYSTTEIARWSNGDRRNSKMNRQAEAGRQASVHCGKSIVVRRKKNSNQEAKGGKNRPRTQRNFTDCTSTTKATTCRFRTSTPLSVLTAVPSQTNRRHNTNKQESGTTQCGVGVGEPRTDQSEWSAGQTSVPLPPDLDAQSNHGQGGLPTPDAEAFVGRSLRRRRAPTTRYYHPFPSLIPIRTLVVGCIKSKAASTDWLD